MKGFEDSCKNNYKLPNHRCNGGGMMEPLEEQVASTSSTFDTNGEEGVHTVNADNCMIVS